MFCMLTLLLSGSSLKNCLSTGSSSSSSWISFKRSRLILASWKDCRKPRSCSIGLFSWPTMYWMAIMAPKVSCPSITDLATIKVIRMFFPSLIKKAPNCWYCPKARLFMLNLNKPAWIRSHSQRFCCSQLFSLISCMPLMSCTILLWFSEEMSNRLKSSSRRFLRKKITQRL
ncbi:hypothetical protein D3C86_1319260 [compost metagenome]